MGNHKEITQTPDSSDDNKWADYIELLCLKNKDRILTVDALVDRIKDEKSVSSASDDNDSEITDSEKRDIKHQVVLDKFAFASSRVYLFGEYYPFIYHIDSSYFQLKENLNRKHYLYLYLLFASNLDYYRGSMSELTSMFEFISSLALKGILSDKCSVEIFGRSMNKSEFFTQTKLSDRIIKLKETLKLPLSPSFREDKISGDFGLDLVAWVEHDENEVGPVYFGQCACGEKWEKKQFDAHIDKWMRAIYFKHPPVSLLYTSHSYRDSQGLCYDEMKIYNTIINDRLRILTKISKKNQSLLHRMLKPFVSQELNSMLSSSE